MKQVITGRQYIFLDESGRPEILSAKGKNLVADGVTSKHLVISAVVTEDPFVLQRQVLEAKLRGIQSNEL
jgi:hypothetical protein